MIIDVIISWLPPAINIVIKLYIIWFVNYKCYVEEFTQNSDKTLFNGYTFNCSVLLKLNEKCYRR